MGNKNDCTCKLLSSRHHHMLAGGDENQTLPLCCNLELSVQCNCLNQEGVGWTWLCHRVYYPRLFHIAPRNCPAGMLAQYEYLCVCKLGFK